MSMTAKLVRMANQIARNFEIHGETEAVGETAEHIRKFWDPRMRDQIQAHVEAGGEGLTDIALDAVKMLGPIHGAHSE